jgi:hypothetical protein
VTTNPYPFHSVGTMVIASEYHSDCTLSEAVSAVERVFSISDGLYTKAEIYRGNELIEKMENPSSVRVESILIQ